MVGVKAALLVDSTAARKADSTAARKVGHWVASSAKHLVVLWVDRLAAEMEHLTVELSVHLTAGLKEYRLAYWTVDQKVDMLVDL